MFWSWNGATCTKRFPVYKMYRRLCNTRQNIQSWYSVVWRFCSLCSVLSFSVGVTWASLLSSSKEKRDREKYSGCDRSSSETVFVSSREKLFFSELSSSRRYSCRLMLHQGHHQSFSAPQEVSRKLDGDGVSSNMGKTGPTRLPRVSRSRMTGYRGVKKLWIHSALSS